MKKLLLAASFGFVAINPLLASDNNFDNLVKINHISTAVVADALAAVDLNDGDKNDAIPTMGEYCTARQADYALGLKAYMDQVDAKDEGRVVTDVLMPRTEIYQPCEDGIFVYKLLNTTSVMNSYLHRASINCFAEISNINFTLADRDFAKKAIFSIFVKKFLPEIQENYSAIMVCQRALKAPGVNVISESIVAFTDEASEEDQKLATAAVQYLSDQPDLRGDQTNIVKAFMDALNNPVFVNVSEAGELMVNNFRGVTIN